MDAQARTPAGAVGDNVALSNNQSLAFRFDQQPKLKGRKRLLQSLHRMSSSPSVGKFGRSSSALGYRGTERGSISCVTLNSAQSPYGHGFGSPFDSQLYNGFSTAPTSAAGTPSLDTSFIDPSAKVHFLASDGKWTEYKPAASVVFH